VSKWLDFELQALMKHLPWCSKDSQSLRDELIQLTLPPNARLFTFDAISMYTFIDLDHGLEIMKYWLESLKLEGHQVPVEALLAGLELVMRNNIFVYGDTHFLQLIGTAMGTPVAVVFANLYFGWHEKERILPEYQTRLKRLLKHSRFIDDVCGIWLGPTDDEWEAFKRDFDDFGILRWEFSTPATSVNFLDLTIWIENGIIMTRTYQKPNHPYLYIPPHSCHTKGMIKGTIYGLVRKYHEQNSRHSDFLEMTQLLFKRHFARGWPQHTLKPIFVEAERRVKATSASTAVPPPMPPSSNERKKQPFFHLTYHPNDIPRRKIREIYDQECSETLQNILGITKFTIAYKNPSNIQSIVAKAKLFEVEGREVSKYLMGELG
jgi:hypothetical protein